jgi:hypothetical protein
MSELALKLNPITVKDYSDKFKELATNAIRYHSQERMNLHNWRKKDTDDFFFL